MSTANPRELSRINWPPERVEQLKALYAEGISASRIAMQLGGGISRNAVIGKIFRLKLAKPSVRPRRPKALPRAKREEPALPAISEAQKLERRDHRHNGAAGLAFKIAEANKQGLSRKEAMDSVLGGPDKSDDPSAQRILKSTVWNPLPSSTPRRLHDLGAHQCKWAVGESPFMFCAEPTDGEGIYCQHHAAMAVLRGTPSERQAHKVSRGVAA